METNQNNPSPSEMGNEAQPSLDQLAAVSQQFRNGAVSVVSDKQSPQLTSAEDHYVQMHVVGTQLIENDQTSELEPLIDALKEHLIEMEKGGSNEFNDSFHNGLVRKPDGHFLLAAYDQLRADLGVLKKGTPEWRVALKAEEFRANRIRREGFGDATRGWEANSAKVDEATQVFTNVLHEWRDVGDLKSQARTIYELGQIAWEKKEFTTAAEWQRESRKVAEAAADTISILVARFKEQEAMIYAHHELKEIPKAQTCIAEALNLYRETAQQSVSDEQMPRWRANMPNDLTKAAVLLEDWETVIHTAEFFQNDPYVAKHSDEVWIQAALGEVKKLEADARKKVRGN